MKPTVITGRAETVLQFWFGEIGEDGSVDEATSSRWWKKDPAFDDEIRARFGGLLDAAAAGELGGWRFDPHTALASVILLDQLSRNMYRDSGRAFAYDELAREASQYSLAAGYDEWLHDLEAYFLFMPFMHSEELEDQREGVRLFDERAERAAPGSRVREMLARGADYARRHMAIIERFGRFPHRNRPLGRESTEEELEFLRQPGSSF
jgi:uncharacterized protein (DUF924 family)